MGLGKENPKSSPWTQDWQPATHHTAVFGVCALEMACHTHDGIPEVGHQLRLLDVFGLECLQVIHPWEVQRVKAARVSAWHPPQLQGSSEATGV